MSEHPLLKSANEFLLTGESQNLRIAILTFDAHEKAIFTDLCTLIQNEIAEIGGDYGQTSNDASAFKLASVIIEYCQRSVKVYQVGSK